jgi:predicted nucleotide-binding protein
MRLYLSYRRTDRAIVADVDVALRHLGHDVWWDGLLAPGEAFDRQIANNLQAAEAVIAFISVNSKTGVQSHREVQLAADLSKVIVPVLLDDVELRDLPLPPALSVSVDARRTRDAKQVAQLINDRLPSHTKAQTSATLDVSSVRALASEVRDEAEPTTPHAPAPKAVFVVHGHDEEMMSDVSEFLRAQGVEPIVLKRIRGGQNTLFDKFRTVGGQAKFAVVLISADDYGSSVVEYTEDSAGERALLYRARQNVVLETGFFFGRLGWDNVFVLVKPPPKRIPRFERPSDLEGVIFEPYDSSGDWKTFLRDQLRARQLI